MFRQKEDKLTEVDITVHHHAGSGKAHHCSNYFYVQDSLHIYLCPRIMGETSLFQSQKNSNLNNKIHSGPIY